VCHRVQLGVYLRACSGVRLRASTELTWERIVKQVGSVPSSAIGSEHESMLWSALESVLGSVFENVLGSLIESVLRAYLGACKEVHLEYQVHIIACVS
jgi:hypothetical protein